MFVMIKINHMKSVFIGQNRSLSVMFGYQLLYKSAKLMLRIVCKIFFALQYSCKTKSTYKTFLKSFIVGNIFLWV